MNRYRGVRVPRFCERCQRCEFEGFVFGIWVEVHLTAQEDGGMLCKKCEADCRARGITQMTRVEQAPKTSKYKIHGTPKIKLTTKSVEDFNLPKWGPAEETA